MPPALFQRSRQPGRRGLPGILDQRNSQSVWGRDLQCARQACGGREMPAGEFHRPPDGTGLRHFLRSCLRAARPRVATEFCHPAWRLLVSLGDQSGLPTSHKSRLLAQSFSGHSRRQCPVVGTCWCKSGIPWLRPLLKQGLLLLAPPVLVTLIISPTRRSRSLPRALPPERLLAIGLLRLLSAGPRPHGEPGTFSPRPCRKLFESTG